MPIINGKPGTRWRNTTGRVRYQLRVAGIGTCSFCWSLDGQIADHWGIPLHRFCRCRAEPVYPGDLAAPFVNLAAKARRLPAARQEQLMGDALRRLWRAGVIDWDAIFRPDGPRSLAEIVALKRLSLKAMIAVGIPAWIAGRARDEAADKPPERIAADRRAARVARLTEPDDGLDDALIAAHLGAGATLAAGLALAAPDHGATQAAAIAAALPR